MRQHIEAVVGADLNFPHLTMVSKKPFCQGQQTTLEDKFINHWIINDFLPFLNSILTEYEDTSSLPGTNDHL